MAVKERTVEARETRRSRPTLPIVALLMVLIGAGVIVVAMVRNPEPPRTVKVTPNSIELDFGRATTGEPPSRQDVADAQPELEQRVTQLEQQAQSSAASTAHSAVDISGYWQGSNGMTYRFDQYGTRVVFQEVSPYGLTATGSGDVDGAQVSVSFTAVNGVSGRSDLIADGNTLSGTFRNAYGSTPITMIR